MNLTLQNGFGKLSENQRMLIKILACVVFIKLSLFLMAFILTGAVSHEAQKPRSLLSLSVMYRTLEHVVYLSDSAWYQQIAQDGYTKAPFSAQQQQNWAFFPVWPALLKVGMVAGFDHIVWAAMLSFLFSMGFSIYLYLLFRLDFSESVSLCAVLLINLFPSAYFFFRSGTEALFLFCISSSIYYARKGGWTAASLAGAVGALSRFQGIFVLLPLFVILLRQYLKEGFKPSYVLIGIVPAAVASFFLYLYLITGNYFAAVDIQVCWGNTFDGLFTSYLSQIREAKFVGFWGWDLSVVTLLVLTFCLLALLTSLFLWKKGIYPVEYLIYTLPNVLLLFTKASLLSSVRYIGMIFPLMLIPVIVTENRPALRQMIFFFSTALLMLLFLSAVLGYQWATA